MVERRTERDIFLHESRQIRSYVSPRVIILIGKEEFLLVPYEATRWLGLPGGKVKESEVAKKSNFLSSGAFPTLSREVKEECGIDISGSLETSYCLGLAEINIVDNSIRRITLSYAPIFFCPVSRIGKVKKGVRIVNIRSHLPGPLFPDARMGISRLKEILEADKRGPAYFEFLNDECACYIELRPKVKQLMGPPDWLYYSPPT